MFVRLLKNLKARRARLSGPGSASLDDALREVQRGEADRARAQLRGFERSPHAAAAFAKLGTLFATSARWGDALEAFTKAVELDPHNARTWADLGNVCQQRKQPTQALQHYARALELDPDDALSWNNVGVLHWESDRRGQARAAFRNALRSDSLLTEALRNLLSCKLKDEDELLIRRIRSTHPEYAAGAGAMGILLLDRHFDTAGALRELDLAIELGFAEADVYVSRGIALQDLGRNEEAVQSYSRAIELHPEDVKARWHRSLCLLLMGRFSEAWDGYEERLRQIQPAPRHTPFPRWQGEALPDATLLIHAEQGLGDEIMFGTCVPEAMARVGRCVIECHPKLAGLFQRAFPQAVVRGSPQTESLDWSHQYRPAAQIPIGSLPRLFRPTAEHFPRRIDYLKADPARRDHWRARLDELGAGPKVGLSWRGGTLASHSPVRSIDASKLLERLSGQPIHLINVQYDANGDEVRALTAESGVKVHHWDGALEDYEQTAALVSELDLVVSVCTAVVHLGGALGKPVWVLAPFSPEWRYGAAGERMPWYPSVRVFRQTAYREWDALLDGVVRRLSTELIGDAA